MEILERIQALCKETGTNPSKVEKELGFGRGTLYKWAKSKPNTDKLSKVAEFFGVSVDYLLGRTVDFADYKKTDLTNRSNDEFKNFSVDIKNSMILKRTEQDTIRESNLSDDVYAIGQVINFPIISTVRAGWGGVAIEEYEGMESIPLSFLDGYKPEECFVLRVKGDSMYPRFLDGDRVLVFRTSSVDSGSIAIVLFNGDEATLKKVKYVSGQDWLELVPINPDYQVKRIEGVDLEQCRVLGKVIKLIRDV